MRVVYEHLQWVAIIKCRAADPKITEQLPNVHMFNTFVSEMAPLQSIPGVDRRGNLWSYQLPGTKRRSKRREAQVSVYGTLHFGRAVPYRGRTPTTPPHAQHEGRPYRILLGQRRT